MRVYIGIDWSEEKHDVTLLNESGVILGQLTMPHTPEGLLKLEEARRQLGLAPEACLVALETAHHLLIDFLWDSGYHHRCMSSRPASSRAVVAAMARVQLEMIAGTAA
jgi:hypothetical protein